MRRCPRCLGLIHEGLAIRAGPVQGKRSSLDTQRTDARVESSVLNRMTQLGIPEAVRLG